MQDAMLLRQANITHAVIICSHAQLSHMPSPEELSVAEVLAWLLADAQLAQAVRSCAAAGVQAKLVLVEQPDQVGTCGVHVVTHAQQTGLARHKVFTVVLVLTGLERQVCMLHFVPHKIVSSQVKGVVSQPQGQLKQQPDV